MIVYSYLPFFVFSLLDIPVQELQRRHSEARLGSSGGLTPGGMESSLAPPRSTDIRRHSDVSPASLKELERVRYPFTNSGQTQQLLFTSTTKFNSRGSILTSTTNTIVLFLFFSWKEALRMNLRSAPRLLTWEIAEPIAHREINPLLTDHEGLQGKLEYNGNSCKIFVRILWVAVILKLLFNL